MSNLSPYSPTNIERPPFYRAPRNQHRPQSDYPWKVPQVQMHQNLQVPNNNRMYTGSNQTQNQVPKPFGLSPIGSNRSSDSSVEQNAYSTIYERSVANDGTSPIHRTKSVSQRIYQQQPTSTVHKSLNNSKQTMRIIEKDTSNDVKQWSNTSQNLAQQLGLPQSSHTKQQQQQQQQQHRQYQSQQVPSPTLEQVSPGAEVSRSNASQPTSEECSSLRGAATRSSPLANQELIGSGMIIGHIPAFKTVLPNSKKEEFMWNRELERASITHQTYRTLPIVQPKPKARHDLATGNYMRLVSDPTWNLHQSRPPSVAAKNYEEKIRQAISNMGNQIGPNSKVIIPHNSPINLYLPSSNKSSIKESSPSRAVRQNNMNDPDQPIFNYKEYIDSTRRAH